jgi:hypothetical protein
MGSAQRHRLPALARVLAVVVLIAVLLSPASAVAALPAAAKATGVSTLAGSQPAKHWVRVDQYAEVSAFANQGLATVSTTVIYRGDYSIPLRLRFQGWTHIGDPDAAGGYIFDAYQGPSTAKMYEVTTPAGKHYDYVHSLVSGEMPNNSFATVSPDSKWLVSGEWGQMMTRLLVFPTPLLNTRQKAGGDLKLRTTINLTSTVSNLQGCDFIDPLHLLCSSDDPTDKQLLQVDLPRRVDGKSMTATVSSLLPLPMESPCAGTFEVEGIDYSTTTGDLRVEVVPPSPCDVTTTVYRFRYQ